MNTVVCWVSGDIPVTCACMSYGCGVINVCLFMAGLPAFCKPWEESLVELPIVKLSSWMSSGTQTQFLIFSEILNKNN